ncbi:hypothetical protein D3C86_2064080 [compost metagenome]
MREPQPLPPPIIEPRPAPAIPPPMALAVRFVWYGFMLVEFRAMPPPVAPVMPLASVSSC